MAEGVLMPKEGITVESCIIGEWKKNVGDQVNVGDILFTYETDKAEFECESTAAGTLLEKFYEDGDEVPCLVNVCAIGNPGEDTSALKNAPAASAAPAAAAAEAPKAAAPAAAAAPAGPCAQAVIMPKEGITAAEYRRLKTGILTTKNERSHLDVIDIQHECEAVVITGGCCSMSQIIEVWPELVSELEVTSERLTGGAASMNQTAEVWPELTEALEILTYRHTGGAASTAQAVEVWPELAAVVEITVTRETGGAAHTDQALEVWPELTEQIEATTELDRSGGTAASQVVEIYPEGGG